MKYRTKLYIALAGTALVSSLIGFFTLYVQFKHHAFLDEQVKGITVVATAAALLDAEALKVLHSPADESTPAYQAVKDQLIQARDANRRQHIFIKYLYTLKPNPENPKQLIFLVDAEQDPKHVNHIGSVDPNAYAKDILNHLGDYYSPGKIVNDPLGRWISAYAPIYDQAGKYVATVGTDISAERYLFDLQRMVQLFFLAFFITLAFAVIGGYFLSRRVTLCLRSLLTTVRQVGQGNLTAKAFLTTEDEFEELACEINMMTNGLQERERLKFNFARYVSQHVLENVLKTESLSKLKGERRKITVLFSDIRQFSQLAERLPPEQVVALLNEYFEAMIDVIFKYQGTLDKFLGDGLMVEFGAPLDDSIQEKHAVQAAIEMQKELKKLLNRWQKEGKPWIEMGIGIHTGFAIVGNIGSEKRVEYTAIGDAVNVASRIEQATKLLKKSILISETTYQAIKNEFKTASLGPLTFAGRKEAISLYAIELEERN